MNTCNLSAPETLAREIFCAEQHIIAVAEAGEKTLTSNTDWLTHEKSLAVER